jgi:coenzyme PQQ biosynthesis protein PqqD
MTGAPLLLYPEGVLELNETAHEVAKRCDGNSTIADIIAALGHQYEVEPGEIEQDVLDCVGDLARRSLIVLRP